MSPAALSSRAALGCHALLLLLLHVMLTCVAACMPMLLYQTPCLPLCCPCVWQFKKGFRTIQVKSGKAYIRKASALAGRVLRIMMRGC